MGLGTFYNLSLEDFGVLPLDGGQRGKKLLCFSQVNPSPSLELRLRPGPLEDTMARSRWWEAGVRSLEPKAVELINPFH